MPTSHTEHRLHNRIVSSSLHRAFLRSVAAAVIALCGPSAARAAEEAGGRRSAIWLDPDRLSTLQERFSEYRDTLPDPKLLGVGRIVAYEEHPLFVYVRGELKVRRPGGDLELDRRILFLKPSVFLIDNRVQGLRAIRAAGPRREGEPQPERGGLRYTQGEGRRMAWKTLLADGRPEDAAAPRQGRIVHVLDLLAPGAEESNLQAEVEAGQQISIRTPERRFRLTLPGSADAAERIEIASADGERLLGPRLLPAGVLPHGPQGVAMLERWDSAYRRGRPGWDVGRPASDLKQPVADGTIRPGRIVELGCGSGTNAIYLAQQGFDVTAIDVAPTALAQAQDKAAEAGVQVRWLLADVTAPPELEPFDAVFDRGCYHGVRCGAAAQYVEALRQLTQPGSKILILAGNANEQRGGGPPRVTEQEIRGDFADGFDIVWLKETRFDSAGADRSGALAWSILLERKADD